MLSAEGGCIFKSPVSEQITTALSGKALSADAETIYRITDEFYMSFRAEFPDFASHPTLVGFISDNIYKHIYVNELVTNFEYVIEIQAMLTELDQGGEYYQAINIVSDGFRKYLKSV